VRRRIFVFVYHVLNAASILAWLISLGLGLILTTVVGWLASLESSWQWPLWLGVFLLSTGVALALVGWILPPPRQPIARSLAHPEWTDPEDLRAYFRSIKAVMEEEGFPSPRVVGAMADAPLASRADPPHSIHDERDALISRGHDILAQMAASTTAVGAIATAGQRAMGHPAAIAFVRDGQELVSRVLPSRARPELIDNYRTMEEARFAIKETLSALANIGHKVPS
jgi:hypothetical protein